MVLGFLIGALLAVGNKLFQLGRQKFGSQGKEEKRKETIKEMRSIMRMHRAVDMMFLEKEEVDKMYEKFDEMVQNPEMADALGDGDAGAVFRMFGEKIATCDMGLSKETRKTMSSIFTMLGEAF